MNNDIYDVLIIGCGPAGLSAAVYTARAVFGDIKKGNLYKAHIIENYLGFPEPISGPELCKKGVKHAKKFRVEIIENEIVDIKIQKKEEFILKDNTGDFYRGKTIIIATGQSYALGGIKNEKKFTGKGVSYCVTCDGNFFRNKNVVIIGNGDYAAEEALQLLNYTKKITILSHGKDFDFSKNMNKKLRENKIQKRKTARITEISGREKVEKLIIMGGEEIPAEGVFIAVGVAGVTAFAKKLGLEMDNNYIKTDKQGCTNIPGIFAAGDCTGAPPQMASSVGGGCNAALSAIKSLRGLKAYIDYN
jgi:thioredoxin reductase (NADPH)